LELVRRTDISIGVGKELCKILYQHNGTVYVAGRSQSKADSAIEEIKQAHPNSDGRLEFLHVDLADLPTIKKSVEDFMNREQRLDVLTNSEFRFFRDVAADQYAGQTCYSLALGTLNIAHMQKIHRIAC